MVQKYYIPLTGHIQEYPHTYFVVVVVFLTISPSRPHTPEKIACLAAARPSRNHTQRPIAPSKALHPSRNPCTATHWSVRVRVRSGNELCSPSIHPMLALWFIIQNISQGLENVVRPLAQRFASGFCFSCCFQAFLAEKRYGGILVCSLMGVYNIFQGWCWGSTFICYFVCMYIYHPYNCCLLSQSFKNK